MSTKDLSYKDKVVEHLSHLNLSQDENLNEHRNSVKLGDRIVWVRENSRGNSNEAGIVKWLGIIDNEEIAGIEFDNPLGLGSGWYKNKQLFTCSSDCGGLVAVAGLILERDFYSENLTLPTLSKDIIHLTTPSPSPSASSSASGGVSSSSPSSNPSPSSNYFYQNNQNHINDLGEVGFYSNNYSQHQSYQQNHQSQNQRKNGSDKSSPVVEQLNSDEIDGFNNASGVSLVRRPSLTESNNNCIPIEFQIDESDEMPPVNYIRPPLKEDDAERMNGHSKGIQGHRNSCYLDATLFSMFSFTSVFDSILLRETHRPYDQELIDEDLARAVRKILRDDIVNNFRKDLFCPANNVMKLREALQHLDYKMISEEMDPQEFMQILFKQVLNLREFLGLSSGESDYFHQLLVQYSDRDRIKIPTVQQLFEQSLIMQELKLKSIPTPALILQMPRSGNKYKMYEGIIPNLSIDITDLIENTPRMCIICGKLATWECPKCYGLFSIGSGDGGESNGHGGGSSSGAESTAFCQICLQNIHLRKERANHHDFFTEIKYNFSQQTYFPDQDPRSPRSRNSSYNITSVLNNPMHYNNSQQRPIPRVTMELFAVICIETSHFVSFVKCGPSRTSPWVFFDSMADRIESPNGSGHNVPQVKILPKMGLWLDLLEKDVRMRNIRNLESISPELKRLITDAYICLYYAPKPSMYK